MSDENDPPELTEPISSEDDGEGPTDEDYGGSDACPAMLACCWVGGLDASWRPSRCGLQTLQGRLRAVHLVYLQPLILCDSWSADPDEASEHEGTSEEATDSDEEQADCPEEDSSAAYDSDGEGFPTLFCTGSQAGEEGSSDAQVSLGCEGGRCNACHRQPGGG